MRNKLCIGLMAIVSGAYWLQRQGKCWGATYNEVHRALPGDELVPHPMLETTHAITIEAPRSAVWPWLMQMGYDRGWWYTDARWYRWVDKYIWKAKSHVSPDTIVPELQHLAAGDTILDGPPGTAFFTVSALEQEHALALFSTTHMLFLAPAFVRNNPRAGLHGTFSWVFVLEDCGEATTRLIVRTRASYDPPLFRALTTPMLYPADFLIARMMLSGIKQRAEQYNKTIPAVEPVEVTAGG